MEKVVITVKEHKRKKKHDCEQLSQGWEGERGVRREGEEER